MIKRLKDKKIEIMVNTEIIEYGEAISTWAPIHSGTLWAYVRQLSAKEYYSSRQGVSSEEQTLFVINWRDDITNLHMIKYKNKYYNIKRVDTFEGYKQDIQVFADAGSMNQPV